MSGLALEIDQTLQRLDAATAQRFERLVRDALELVKRPPSEARKSAAVRFPLVTDAHVISDDDVASLQDEA